MVASMFAIGAIVLVAIGVFGVVAQTAGWRTHEMGVRLALGDVPPGIVRRVLVEPIGAVGVGLIGAGAVAVLAARAAGSYLYGIEPYDLRLWAATVVALLATAAVAAAVPGGQSRSRRSDYGLEAGLRTGRRRARVLTNSSRLPSLLTWPPPLPAGA